MSIPEEKIFEILKSKGSTAAVEQIKTAYDISFNEAKEIVDNILAKNPGIVLPVRTFKIY
ncbi:MAG: hypothetical protein QM802_23180 [Agriterribacter sp.]